MGVCMKWKLREDEREGKLEGVRLSFYDYLYSGKEVVSIKKWNKLVKDELSRLDYHWSFCQFGMCLVLMSRNHKWIEVSLCDKDSFTHQLSVYDLNL